jgi:AraC-like DNA-binding protein
MTEASQPGIGIQHLNYQPDGSYPLDLEIFTVSDLRRRVGAGALSATYRYAFPTLICVTRGTSTHVVDFAPVRCEPGSLLVLRPGKAHSFGYEEDWDGWMILFRSEFLWASSATAPDQTAVGGLDGLPAHLTLDDAEMPVVTAAIAQMRADARMNAASPTVHALLRYQLYTLLARIRIIHERQAAQAMPGTRAIQRFRDFESLVEKKFTAWHKIAQYAAELGCSEKSLTRASMEAAGVNAKAIITARIALEAKRMLAHTALSVSRISERIGFNDLANFVKFFKREVGCTPTEFRRQQTLRPPS